MAAFMLATGAPAMGMPVSMFFTFWGLAALKKETSFKNKNLMERLLTAMLPSGPAAVGVSKLNLCGLGKRFFTSLMRKHCVEPLSNLIHLACEMNIRMVACQTSMELMAIRKEELLAGVECGGVATCLDTAIGCGATVFI